MEKLWLLPQSHKEETEMRTAEATGEKGSVLLFGSGGFSIGSEHSPWGRVGALLEQGPSCRGVSPCLGLIPLRESCGPRAPGENRELRVQQEGAMGVP